MELPTSDVPEKVPNPHVRPLRAIAKGGAGDINLLAGRAADEIERLVSRVTDLQKQLASHAKPIGY
jgi:hypothetical protein